MTKLFVFPTFFSFGGFISRLFIGVLPWTSVRDFPPVPLICLLEHSRPHGFSGKASSPFFLTFRRFPLCLSSCPFFFCQGDCPPVAHSSHFWIPIPSIWLVLFSAGGWVMSVELFGVRIFGVCGELLGGRICVVRWNGSVSSRHSTPARCTGRHYWRTARHLVNHYILIVVRYYYLGRTNEVMF